MGAVFVFDYGVWSLSYPELATSVNEVMAQNYFDIVASGSALDNSGAGQISDALQLRTLFNLLVSHMAALFAPLNGQQSSTLVGRISNASEGSVSVAVNMPEAASGMEAWLMQTKYGAVFWVMTARYRTFRYHPGRQRFRQVWPYGYPGI